MFTILTTLYSLLNEIQTRKPSNDAWEADDQAIYWILLSKDYKWRFVHGENDGWKDWAICEEGNVTRNWKELDGTTLLVYRQTIAWDNIIDKNIDLGFEGDVFYVLG